MKTRVLFILFLTSLAVLLHTYLAVHTYPLKLGFGSEESLCKISEHFDCQAVSASSFGSVFNIPLSVWGLVTNGLIFVLVLLGWWRLTGSPKKPFRNAFFLSSVAAIASLVMGIISLLFLSVYCLFCLILYVISFATFELLREIQEPWLWREINFKNLVLIFLCIPLFSYAIHSMILSQYGAGGIGRMVENSFLDWQNAETFKFKSEPLLTLGPKESKMVITEFADFRCSHCKAAAPSLEAFAKSHSDVRFEFYIFPLDGDCNKELTQGNGVSCALAKSVVCAPPEKQWSLHHALFQNYESLIRSVNKESTVKEISPLTEKLGFQIDDGCLSSTQTQEVIAKMVETATLVHVEGTPTIFVNGKKLSRGQMIPLLERVYLNLKSDQ